MLISDLSKKEVLDSRANKVGYIIDVDLNVTQGTVSHYILRTGVLKKVPLMPDRVDKVGEKVLLKITRDEVEGRTVGTVV